MEAGNRIARSEIQGPTSFIVISLRLRWLIGLSIPLFVIHGTEEYWLGFYNIYPSIQSVAAHFQTIPQAGFFVFQIMYWLMLLVMFAFSLGGKWQFIPLAILGCVYFYELQHPFTAVLRGSYYPGLLTSLPFPIIGILYWKELIQIWRDMPVTS